VYKYNPKKNRVQPHYGPISMILAACFILFVWGLIASAVIRPAWIGVAASCIAEQALLLMCIFLTTATNRRFALTKPYIDETLIKQAWLDSKKQHIESLGLASRGRT